jgi:flagellar basal body-associated protein FliL
VLAGDGGGLGFIRKDYRPANRKGIGTAMSLVFLIIIILIVSAVLLFVALGAIMLTTWLSSRGRRDDKR